MAVHIGAHNEYLQWFAEFGYLGHNAHFSCCVVDMEIHKVSLRRKCFLSKLPGLCDAFSDTVDAVFRKAFHRIENVVWLSFAFAIANRELLPLSYTWSEVRHTSIYRVLGIFICTISVFGLVFLWNGLAGDKYLRYAADTDRAELQAEYIKKAMSKAMTRDEAEEQYANHLMAVAKVTRDPQDWANAINQMYRSFTIRPQAKQLMELLNLARQIRNQELLKVWSHIFLLPE